MNKLFISLALILGFSGVAHADIMIEPYIGYEMGKVTDPDGTANGTSIGARLAYKAPIMFWFGLDGAMSSGTSKPDSGSNADFKRTAIYGVVGVDFPILFRAWAGYALSDQVKLDGTPESTVKNKTYKLGVGFTGLPFVSLNVEYIKAKADTIEAGGVTDSSPNLQNEAVLLSVSLPLEF